MGFIFLRRWCEIGGIGFDKQPVRRDILNQLSQFSAPDFYSQNTRNSDIKAQIQISCKLCFEVCPVEGALFQVEGTRNRKEVIFPRVDPALCIGCGACESVCPVEGELAVQVFAPGFVPESELALLSRLAQR